MKYIACLCGAVLLLVLSGCEAEAPYGGGYGVYGEYPYGYSPAPVYVYPDYPYRYRHPYDRDHYYDRDRYWDRDHYWH